MQDGTGLYICTLRGWQLLGWRAVGVHSQPASTTGRHYWPCVSGHASTGQIGPIKHCFQGTAGQQPRNASTQSQSQQYWITIASIACPQRWMRAPANRSLVEAEGPPNHANSRSTGPPKTTTRKPHGDTIFPQRATQHVSTPTTHSRTGRYGRLFPPPPGVSQSPLAARLDLQHQAASRPSSGATSRCLHRQAHIETATLFLR